MLSVNLQGGLGNKLFQIFTGISYCVKNKRKFCIPKDDVNILFPGISICSLGNLEIYSEPDFTFSELSVPKGDCILNGYFQSWKYITVNPWDYISPPPKIKIERTRVLISIHVRRGDYLQKQDFHPVMGMSYYQNAMAEMENILSTNSVHKVTYLIFSDDIPWCQEHFKSGCRNYSFVDGIGDVQALFLMASCDHHIIGNSSFSWWGAYLGWVKDPNKKHCVVYPSLWFQKWVNVVDLCPPEWIRCEVNYTEPLVSVVIPSYSRFDSLVRAIQSVHNQDWDNLEIIVIVDSYTDERYLSLTKEHVTSIFLPENLKAPGLVRNYGLKIASGKYIAFLDDDDVFLSDKLHIQIREMQGKSCNISTTEALFGKGAMNIDMLERYLLYISEYHKEELERKGVLQSERIWNFDFLKKHNNCITSSIILKKSLVDKVGFFNNLKLGEDYDYWLRCVEECGGILYIDRPTVYYDGNHGKT